jgi:alpha-tubulin suppressor-like RCC1 family protein
LIQELSHHRVRQVAICYETCAAVTEEGLLYTWVTTAFRESYGVADVEQRRPILGLGLDGTTLDTLWPPQCVTALSMERVSSVAVGRRFTLVTTEAGAVYFFGDGKLVTNLGHGDREIHVLPKRVEALDAFYVAAVAAGPWQFLALIACGRVCWWGDHLKSTTESRN